MLFLYYLPSEFEVKRVGRGVGAYSAARLDLWLSV